MLALILLDHRLALVCLCALLLATAVPLVYAWARVLPEDAPPLAPSERDPREVRKFIYHEAPRTRPPLLAILLLGFVTVSYAVQFPGVPRDAALRYLESLVPDAQVHWIAIAVGGLFVFIPGLAACYAVLRPNPIRVPLIVAGVLVLLLWLLQPYLYAALVAAS